MKNTILRASIAVSAATVLLRLLGFLREIVLASNFGAGSVSDAFVIAMTAPGIVLAVVSSTVTAIYIPQYTGIDGEAGREKFTNGVLTLLFFAGLVFAAVFTAYPQALVYVFASSLEPEAFELAVIFLRIMVWSAIPLLLMGIFRAYLQIKSLFFTAMISEALINLFAVTSIVSGKATGSLILLGIGAAAGNAASMAVLYIFCRRKGLRLRPRFNPRDEHIASMFRLMLPLALSAAVLEINQIIDKNLASSLVSGTVSSLNYAVKINNVVAALIGTAVTTALFPKMAELAAGDDIGELKKHLVTCVTSLLPLLLPLTAGVMIMARPIIRILLERGAFNPEDTARTAQCLQMYAVGMLAGNLAPLVTRAFYAMRRARLPAIISAVSVAIGIALNLLMIGTLKHRGLALATSISNTLCLALLLVALRKKVGPLGLRPQMGEFLKIVAATAIMGAAVWYAVRHAPVLSGSYAQCLTWTVAIAGGAAVLYGALLVLLRVKAVRGARRKRT
ncbi:MAG: murein biosynthesis integral membrane protein MurJ [Oscillospiraceae bacterium]|jgi:putative peptidoglycan lipid II flippase|nr:murein biosynthesis integral membrane protein MurJ [Oscillospiraceae bacterium]